MSDWTGMHLLPPVAANLAALGWSAAHPRVREVTPTTARGHNAVVVAPPAPAWAGPALAGALSRLAEAGTGRLLLVAPPEAVSEWGALAGTLVAGTPLRLLSARGPSRATRLLRAGEVDVLVASSDIALELLSRSALKTDTLSSIVLAWPERWAGEDLLPLLMQELPAEAQRLVVSTDPARAADLAERHARRALTVGTAAAAGTAGPVRTVSVPWERRVAAVADLVELLDPAALTVWTVDQRWHAQLRTVLAGAAPAAQLTTEVPGEAAGLVIALDLPDPETLRGLLGAGEVILLVPPGAEQWLAGVAAPRRPLLLPGVVDAAASEVRRRRQAIGRALEGLDATEASLVLAPLFERHEAPAVAAALYALWSRREPARAEPVAAGTGPSAKLWIGIGRRDEVGPNELVAFLTREVAVDKALIGRIEVRENYCLVEVPPSEAERIAEAVSGRTLRRRRLTARIDRGPAPAGGRPPRPRG